MSSIPAARLVTGVRLLQDSAELGRHFCSEVHAVEVTVKFKAHNPHHSEYGLSTSTAKSQCSLYNMKKTRLSI